MENQNILEATKLETLSSKYETIRSKDVLRELELKGFVLDDVIKLKTKKAERQGKQKHRMLLSHPDLLATNHDDGKIQLLVTNSYDGTSSLIFQVGFFRYVCANGLVFGNSFHDIKIKHIGKGIQKQIDDAIVEIVAQAKKLNSVITNLKNTKLTLGQVVELEKRAVSLRLAEDKQKDLVAVNINTLREEDRGLDLFTVYNKVQEAVIRGNAIVTLVNADNQVNTRKLREVKSIDSTTNLNVKLFNIVEEYMQVA
jgi:hypothetical protein